VKAYVQALQREIDRADRPCDIEISAAIGYAWTDDREKKLDEADKAMYEKKEKMKQKR
jgi:GGDEF domain-containing protein